MNLGDIVICRTLFSDLRSHGHLVIIDRDVSEIVLKRMEIQETECLSRITSLPPLLFIVLITALRFFNPSFKTFYVEIPGHRFSSNPKSFREFLYQLCFHINEAYRLTVLRLCRVRICKFGLSIGPLSRISAWFERWIKHLTHFYSVRESASVNYLGTMGIENVSFFPDFGWLSFRGNKWESPTKKVIFSFRESTHSLSIREGYEESLYEVLDPLVPHLTQMGYSILVTFQVAFDEPIAQRIYKRYRSNPAVTYNPELINENTFTLYANAAFIVSNRLHALIFGAMQGAIPVPLVNMNDHLKIIGIFNDLGLHDLMLNLKAGPAEAKKIQYALDHAEQIKQKIALHVETQRAAADQKLDELFS